MANNSATTFPPGWLLPSALPALPPLLSLTCPETLCLEAALLLVSYAYDKILWPSTVQILDQPTSVPAIKIRSSSFNYKTYDLINCRVLKHLVMLTATATAGYIYLPLLPLTTTTSWFPFIHDQLPLRSPWMMGGNCEAWFLKISTTDICTGLFFVAEGSPVRSSISSLFPLDASSIPTHKSCSVMTTESVSKHSQVFPGSGRQRYPQLKTIAVKET